MWNLWRNKKSIYRKNVGNTEIINDKEVKYMIEKKKGLINELIYNQTIYNNGKSRMYPNIMGLELLIKNLCLIDETCNYIRFNPFYRNSRLNCQIEFADYMFYMESRENFTKDDLVEHWNQCTNRVYDIPHKVKQYEEIKEYYKKKAPILYPLCKKGDYQQFHKFLKIYKEYLNELIPLLFEKVIEELDLNQDDIAFGYFCFEVHSG